MNSKIAKAVLSIGSILALSFMPISASAADVSSGNAQVGNSLTRVARGTCSVDRWNNQARIQCNAFGGRARGRIVCNNWPDQTTQWISRARLGPMDL